MEPTNKGCICRKDNFIFVWILLMIVFLGYTYNCIIQCYQAILCVRVILYLANLFMFVCVIISLYELANTRFELKIIVHT